MQTEIEVPGQRIRVAGRITVRELPDLRDTLLEALHAGTGELLVEVSDVIVADATVLGLLMEGHRKAERTDRQLVLLNIPADLDRLLRRTKLGRVLHCRALNGAVLPCG